MTTTTTIPPHRHAERAGTAAQWTSANPVLGEDEVGWESDTALMKVGDGVTAWNDLPYANRGPAGTDGTNGAPGSTDLTFSDNGDGTGTISWAAGANTVTFPLLTAGLITAGVIPAVALSTVTVVADEAAMLALTAQQGDVAVRSDNSTTYMLKTSGDPTVLADWIVITPPGAVVSVAGKTGAITLVAADISDATTTGKAVMTAANQANARAALGLGGSATLDVGTAAGTVAAGDDSRLAPAPTLANAGKVVTVKADGSGYEVDTPGGSSAPTWTTPTLTGAGAPSGALKLRYSKDAYGWVHFEGAYTTTATISTGATLFTLPTGYRPATNVHLPGLTLTASVIPHIVNTDGTVNLLNGITGGNTIIVNGSFYVG